MVGYSDKPIILRGARNRTLTLHARRARIVKQCLTNEDFEPSLQFGSRGHVT